MNDALVLVPTRRHDANHESTAISALGIMASVLPIIMATIADEL
jgi:hypothetical protein